MLHILPYVVYHIFAPFATLFAKKIYLLLNFFNKIKKKYTLPPLLCAIFPAFDTARRRTAYPDNKSHRAKIFHAKTFWVAFKPQPLLERIVTQNTCAENKRKEARQ